MKLIYAPKEEMFTTDKIVGNHSITVTGIMERQDKKYVIQTGPVRWTLETDKNLDGLLGALVSVEVGAITYCGNNAAYSDDMFIHAKLESHHVIAWNLTEEES